MTSVGGPSGGGGRHGGSPTVQLHKLCVHLIGGAGGGQDLVSSHYMDPCW